MGPSASVAAVRAVEAASVGYNLSVPRNGRAVLVLRGAGARPIPSLARRAARENRKGGVLRAWQLAEDHDRRRGRQLVETIKQGTPFFIGAAVVAQVCKYLAQGRGFQACFNTVNGHISYGTGLSLVFGTFFMNTVAPSMNLAGTSLVMATAAKNGMQAGKGTTAALLMQLSIDTGFVIIMLVTFGALSLTVGLQPGWLAVGAVAIVLVGGLVFVITVGGLKPNLVLKVLRPFVKLADWVLAKFKKDPIDERRTSLRTLRFRPRCPFCGPRCRASARWAASCSWASLSASTIPRRSSAGMWWPRSSP